MTINCFGDTIKQTYNAINKVISQTDSKGNITRFEYDLFGQLKKTIAPDSSFTSKSYDSQGNVSTTTDEVGRNTQFTYDHENRVTKTTFNDGTSTQVKYDPLGRRTMSIDAKGNKTEYEYDNVGNNTFVRDALGNETRYEYDAANRRTAMIDALNHRTEYVYDDYDRLIETKFHDGTSKKTEYDNAGRKIAEIDQENNRTEFAYDSVGNLIQVKDAMQFVTKYKYDANNNRIEQTDANNHMTTIQYDKLNRMVSRTYPNGDQERFGFDKNGNMLSKANDAGDSTIYSYDSRNREIYRKYKSGHEVITHYTPDGKPDTVTDYRGNTIYEYNNRGMQSLVQNPDGSFIRSEFDAQGNRTEQVTPWQTTRYSYDKLNRMDSVVVGNSVTEYFYNAVGNRDSLHNSNGTSTKYYYDNLNRLLLVVNNNPNGIMSSYSYELNNAGIRKAVTEQDGSRVDYGYDPLYRLTSETRTGAHPYSIVYTYDPVGNRLTQNKDGVLTNYTYNTRDQLQTEILPSAIIIYTYDKAGRQTTKTTNGVQTVYSWIDNDRMSSVYNPTVNASYEYDSKGQRVSETNAIETNHYLIDYLLPYGQVIAETDGSNNVNATYVYGLDRISMTRNGNTYTYANDGQGSIRQLTNASGEVTDQYWYTAFGEELAKTGTTENSFRYVGESWDPNSGFYYNRARWYDQGTGRFTSVDPWDGDPQSPVSLHRYLYGNDNPTVYHDPSGKMSILNPMMALAISGIIISSAIIVQQIYMHTVDEAGYKLGIADVLTEINNSVSIAISSVSLSVSVNTIELWTKLAERFKEVERIKERWRNKKYNYAYLKSGPSMDNGARVNNWLNPVQVGSRTWYREGGPDYRLWGRGIFVPNRVEQTYTEIVRFDNKLDKKGFPEYAQYNHVYHFHIGGMDKYHFVVGAD